MSEGTTMGSGNEEKNSVFRKLIEDFHHGTINAESGNEMESRVFELCKISGET